MSNIQQSEKFLFCQPWTTLNGHKLPTTGKITKAFLYRQMCKEVICECQSLGQSSWSSLSDLTYIVIQENVLGIWSKAGIPNMSLQYAKDKLLKLHQKGMFLNKLRIRKSITNEKQRQDFKLELEKLFDIAAPDAKHQIRVDLNMRGKEACDIDWDFLDDQRGPRNMEID